MGSVVAKAVTRMLAGGLRASLQKHTSVCVRACNELATTASSKRVGLTNSVRPMPQKNLGAAFAESPPFDLQAAYGDSVCVTPLIFILSAGADVNDYLLGLGAQKGKTPTNGGLKILSLGQGQGPIAERLMVSGRYDLVGVTAEQRELLSGRGAAWWLKYYRARGGGRGLYDVPDRGGVLP